MILDGDLEVGCNDSSAHASEHIVLLTVLWISHDGIDAALSDDTLVLAVAGEVALWSGRSKLHVFGIHGVVEVLVEFGDKLIGHRSLGLLGGLVVSIELVLSLNAVVALSLDVSIGSPVSVDLSSVSRGGSLNSLSVNGSLD